MEISQFIIIKGRKVNAYSNRRAYSSRMTKGKPRLEHDEVAVQVKLELPEELFDKPALVAKVSVPKEAVSQPVITADVVDNVEDIILQNTGFEVKLEIFGNENEE